MVHEPSRDGEFCQGPRRENHCRVQTEHGRSEERTGELWDGAGRKRARYQSGGESLRKNGQDTHKGGIGILRAWACGNTPPLESFSESQERGVPDLRFDPADSVTTGRVINASLRNVEIELRRMGGGGQDAKGDDRRH